MKKKTACIASLIILVSSFASAFFVNRHGTSRRSYDHAYGIMVTDMPVQAVRNPADVYTLWKRKGYRGRVALHVGRYLHFVSLEGSDGRFNSIDSVPMRTGDLLADYEQRINHRNYLWVAMQSGVARHIFTVLPPEIFKERTNRGNSDITKEGVQLSSMGLRRTITDRIPRLQEPVLLNIDASYFTTQDAASALARELESSGLKADMVTLCLSEGNPDVTDVERLRLTKFVRKFTPWVVYFDYER